MNKKFNILVSGASGIVGYGILKSLRSSGLDLMTVGTSIYHDSVAPAFCDYFEIAPKTNADGYLDWLLSLVQKYHIDMLIPSIEIDMYAWNDFRAELSDKCFCLLNNSDLIKLCHDKWIFYQELIKNCSQYSINTSLEYLGDFSAPFLIKPRIGYGSKGIIKIFSKEQYANIQDSLNSVMYQPIVGKDEEEYTVSAFFDNAHNLCDYFAMRRMLSSQGFTEMAYTVNDIAFEKILTDLAKAFQPIGPTNFQFRKTDEGYKLLEINPRISSATSIRAAFGYNESKYCIEYFLMNKKIEKNKKRTGKAVRYTEDMVFYDSDLV